MATILLYSYFLPSNYAHEIAQFIREGFVEGGGAERGVVSWAYDAIAIADRLVDKNIWVVESQPAFHFFRFVYFTQAFKYTIRHDDSCSEHCGPFGQT